MKRVLALILALILTIGMTASHTFAEEPGTYSLEAAQQFAESWNNYFYTQNINMRAGYVETDDGKTAKRLWIYYNADNMKINYESKLIPSTASLYFTFDPVYCVYGLCMFDDNTESDLENAVFYLDDKIINEAVIGSSHDPRDMWSITLPGTDILDIYQKDEFTLKITVDGKSEIIDISKKKHQYLYNMIDWLIKAQLYTDPENERYRSSLLLPNGLPS